MFEELKAEAMAAFDRIIELDLAEVSLDGSLHKAPYGGEGTGPNTPSYRGRGYGLAHESVLGTGLNDGLREVIGVPDG